jgi:hypothetical protein
MVNLTNPDTMMPNDSVDIEGIVAGALQHLS